MAQLDLDSGKINFFSGVDYQKIYVDGTQVIDNQTIAIPHNFGYYPFIRVWCENDLGDVGELYGQGQNIPSGWWFTIVYHKVTTTDLIITAERPLPATPNPRRVWWRIYYDAA